MVSINVSAQKTILLRYNLNATISLGWLLPFMPLANDIGKSHIVGLNEEARVNELIFVTSFVTASC